ncbi:MAG: autophagy protein 17 [Pleopsidium flavum]|nr:MAG: autophagy protein 17 [Pleopsidium flavum]
MALLKASIDTLNDAQKELEESNQSFDNDLKAVSKGLVSRAASQPSGDDSKPQIPSLLRSLESHAKEMANLLESLVRHYDLCVTAIKHTEGGGAAAERITNDLPEGVDVCKADDDSPSQPISEEEYQEMMTVLEKDASEVEEVVMEIRDRVTEMELQYELIVSSNNNLESVYASTTAAFQLLGKVGLRLRGYITQSRDFVVRWEEEKSRIEDRREELEVLREFYQGFLRAYDGLIVEVGRRKAVQIRMERLVEDAVAKTKRLHEEDMAEREAFRQDQGDYLPSDIWPGLLSPPVQYEVLPTSTVENVPDLPKDIIEQAVRRLRGKL